MSALQLTRMLSKLHVQSAKVIDAFGLWEGSIERAAEATLYDLRRDQVHGILLALGMQLPSEQAFGLDETLYPNPFHAAA